MKAALRPQQTKGFWAIAKVRISKTQKEQRNLIAQHTDYIFGSKFEIAT
jgi:hypothetical protein